MSAGSQDKSSNPARTSGRFPRWAIWLVAIIVLVDLALICVVWTWRTPVAGKTVDLTRGLNGQITEATTVPDDVPSANTLEEFPIGENDFAGVRFSVGGIIQLNGRYPDRVEGISIQKKCHRLHLLHGTAGKMPEGTIIARVVLHYTGGAQEEIPLKYGEHVLDWWQRPKDSPPSPPLILGWSGQNQLTRRENAVLNVYVSSFLNPRRHERIETVDFVSANTGCWPFFLGMTVD